MTAWQVLAGLAGVLGISAFVAWWFREFLLAYLPWLNPARAGRLAQQRDLPLPAGERFVILVADLQGDDDKRTHTRRVAAALEPYRGLDVTPIGPGPEWGVESRDAFEAKARALLVRQRGDLLVSGEVASAGKGVLLRIMPGDRSVEVRHGTSKGRRAGEYALTDTGLSLDFDRDFDAVLVALVAASVAPASERQGHYLVDVLGPATDRLKHLCARCRPVWTRTSAAASGTRSGSRPTCSASRRGRTPGSNRRSPPIAPPWRSGRASASRSTGR